MERIGVRELRQHGSRWLARVEQGESFEVTDRGRPVARLVPSPPAEGWQALVDAGRVYGGDGDFSVLPPPLPVAAVRRR